MIMSEGTWLKSSTVFSVLLFAAVHSQTANAAETGNTHNETTTVDSLKVIVATPPAVQINQDDAVQTQSDVQWYSMITKLPNDWYAFGNAVFDKQSVPTIAELGATTIALVVFDYPSYSQTRHFLNSSNFLRETRNGIVCAGDGKYHLPAIGGLAVIGWATHSKRLLRTTSEMAEAFLASGIVVQILKHSTGRESPIVVTHDEEAAWRLFPNQKQYERHQANYYSFPSGHLATMVGSLTVLNENYPEYRAWLRPASYLLTSLLGVSLVGKGMHWYSDLPLGIVLGYSFGTIAANGNGININSSLSESVPKVSISPSYTINGAGLGVNIAW